MRSVIDRLEGVVIGVLLGFSEVGEPLVVFPGNPHDKAIAARSTAALATIDVGREVALLFEGGDPTRPMVIGRLLRPEPATPHERICSHGQAAGGERLEVVGQDEIMLRCGKASITLTRSGSIRLRGTYISSWSSGAHRIKGASVNIN